MTKNDDNAEVKIGGVGAELGRALREKCREAPKAMAIPAIKITPPAMSRILLINCNSD